jgi:hypothetical protein
MKKILIGGCSFSQYQHQNNPHHPWLAWTDFLKKEYENQYRIINKSKSSYGQSKIVESLIEELIKHNFKIDYVIIQWSAISRAYSQNEGAFLNKILKEKELSFIAYSNDYVRSTNKPNTEITTITNTISSNFYTASLNQIFLMKTLLNSKNIPYKMFWGWEQITDELEIIHSSIINEIYDSNFWRYGKHGGMSEIISDNIGAIEGFNENDFHPSTKGQEFFYNTTIKDIVKTIL